MKIYTFLTNKLSGISGGPLYVRNKSKFLSEQGWQVVAIDNTGILYEPIIIEELKKYGNNRFYELLFPPSWYSKNGRTRVLSKLINLIKKPGENIYVIESDQISLSLWGELLAKELGCKHLIFDINENEVIIDYELYQFLNTKYLQNELFCISPKAVANLFAKYGRKDDYEDHYWDAQAINDVEDVPLDLLENLQKTDFHIGFFGRYKRFIPYVIKEVKVFCLRHSSISISLVFLGILDNQVDLGNVPDNLSILCLGRKNPIPKSFFDYSDVVIATAGCALISVQNVPLVISMSVEEDARVIGFLGRTTSSHSFPDSSDNIIKPLSDYLDLCLSGEALSYTLNGYCQEKFCNKGYYYQISFINNVSNPYNILSIKYIYNRYQILMRILVRTGCVRLAFLLKQLSLRKFRFRN